MLFSVIIPLYNTEKYIKECINSVLEQTERDFELLLIDDGSSDNSGNIASSYAKYDNRIRVIHQNNKGAFYTRCNAVNEVNGEYIVFLDADDTLESNSLEILRENFEEDTNIDMVIFRTRVFGESVKITESEILYSNNTIFVGETKNRLYEKLLSSSSINPMWLKAYKKQVLKIENINDYPKITMGDDIIQSLFPLTHSKKIKYITDILYNYRIINSSMTRTFNPNVYEGFQYVYRDLWNYLEEWNLADEKHIKMYYKRYLSSVSSISLFAKNSIVSKETEYVKMLNDIYNDSLFKEAVKNAHISILQILPIYLIKKRRFNILMIIKKILSKVRK